MGHSYEKRLEVGLLFILGYVDKEIEEKADVSHGSAVSIINDLKTGELQIPGIPTEEVVSLRQLSVELKKKGLQPAQAKLGIAFFKKCADLGVGPTLLDLWADLVKKFAPVDFPAEDFLKAALNLQTVEQSEKASFADLNHNLTEYETTRDGLQQEIAQLQKQRTDLIKDVVSLESDKTAKQHATSQAQEKFDSLNFEIKKTEIKLSKETGIVEHIKAERESMVAIKTELASQIGAKQEALVILKKAGFSETHLFQLRNITLDLAAKQGTSPEFIADEFFTALEHFGGLAGLEAGITEKEKHLVCLKEEEATLSGRVEGLKNQDALLSAKIKTDTETAAEVIRKAVDTAEHAASEFVCELKQRFQELVSVAAETGALVGREMQAQLSAEQSASELKIQIEEIKKRQ